MSTSMKSLNLTMSTDRRSEDSDGPSDVISGNYLAEGDGAESAASNLSLSTISAGNPSMAGISASRSYHDSLLERLDDAIVQEALKSGVDLKKYSNDVNSKLKLAEKEAIGDYLAQASNIAQLHKEIVGCDQILETIEEILTGFQSDLNSVTSDIKLLQENSILLDRSLRNRQQVRGELSQYVDDMIISESMIRSILDSPVTDRDFLEQLHELNHKIAFLKSQQYREAKCCDDVYAVIENLKVKSMEKIREYLLGKIYQFRKPLANYQVPQNAMLKYRFFYEFLLANQRDIAKEIREEYIETISRMFYSYFKTYAGRLFRLEYADAATKDDLLAAEDVARTGGLFASKPHVRSRATVFSIGQRINILTTDLEGALIVPHATNEKYHFEALFRSLVFALVDHASHEYHFLSDFFMATGDASLELFGFIMGRALTVVAKALETQINLQYDAIALALCIQICGRYMQLMEKRVVPALDGFWEQTLNLLNDRFQHVMNMHIDSVRNSDAKRLGPVDTRPHYIVRRYAEFCSALLLARSVGGTQDDRSQLVITKLQSVVEGLMGRLASELKSRKDQLIFMINSYDMILTVLGERLSQESKESASFKELLQTCIQRYIDEVLHPHFGPLMTFVNECEPLADQGHKELLGRYVDKVPTVIKTFNTNWKKAIDQLNIEVMQSFTNFKNGTAILQDALTALVQYYHRFNKILSFPTFADCQSKREMINLHTVVVELKKHKPAFS